MDDVVAGIRLLYHRLHRRPHVFRKLIEHVSYFVRLAPLNLRALTKHVEQSYALQAQIYAIGVRRQLALAVFTFGEILAEIVIFSGQPETLLLTFLQNPDRMPFYPRNAPVIATLAAAAVLSVGSVFGQASKVVGEKPVFEDLQSPQFQLSSGGKDKTFKPKDWLEIEAKLKISLAPEPASKTCDKITVKWYVAVKNPEKPSTMLLRIPNERGSALDRRCGAVT